MQKRTDALYTCLSSERYTPYSLARKIGAKAILESASFAKGRERYSILMAEEAFKVVQDEDGVAFLVDGNRIPFDTTNIDSRDALGHKKDADILDAILYVAEQNNSPATGANAEIPIPASGLGYLSYEFAARCDNIKFFEQKDELNIPELIVTELFYLNGAFVNLEYPLENNTTVKFLNNDEIYLGNQVECEFNDGELNRCYGLVANMNFLLVCEYGPNGEKPEIIVYKKR